MNGGNAISRLQGGLGNGPRGITLRSQKWSEKTSILRSFRARVLHQLVKNAGCCHGTNRLRCSFRASSIEKESQSPVRSAYESTGAPCACDCWKRWLSKAKSPSMLSTHGALVVSQSIPKKIIIILPLQAPPFSHKRPIGKPAICFTHHSHSMPWPIGFLAMLVTSTTS